MVLLLGAVDIETDGLERLLGLLALFAVLLDALAQAGVQVAVNQGGVDGVGADGCFARDGIVGLRAVTLEVLLLRLTRHRVGGGDLHPGGVWLSGGRGVGRDVLGGVGLPEVRHCRHDAGGEQDDRADHDSYESCDPALSEGRDDDDHQGGDPPHDPEQCRRAVRDIPDKGVDHVVGGSETSEETHLGQALADQPDSQSH